MSEAATRSGDAVSGRVAIVRVAALRASDYEWKQHAVLAGDAGISVTEVAAVAEGPDAGERSPLERALLRATDGLIAGATVDDDTWSMLASELDTQQLLDFVFTVGAYDTVAMVFKTFDVELDTDLL